MEDLYSIAYSFIENVIENEFKEFCKGYYGTHTGYYYQDGKRISNVLVNEDSVQRIVGLELKPIWTITLDEIRELTRILDLEKYRYPSLIISSKSSIPVLYIYDKPHVFDPKFRYTSVRLRENGIFGDFVDWDTVTKGIDFLKSKGYLIMFYSLFKSQYIKKGFLTIKE